MHVSMYVCMHVCVYVRMYLCVYVCMYVCMYVYMCVCVGLLNLLIQFGFVSEAYLTHTAHSLRTAIICIVQQDYHCLMISAFWLQWVQSSSSFILLSRAARRPCPLGSH